MQHGTYCNGLMVLGPGISANILTLDSTRWVLSRQLSISSKVASRWCSDLFWNNLEKFRNAPRIDSDHPEFTQPMECEVIPPHQWDDLKWHHPPHKWPHTSMQSPPWPPMLLPNPHYFNPGPAVSLTANLAPIGLASQHMPKTKCPGTAQTCPPDVQTLPVMSRYIQVHPDYPKTCLDHSGSFQDHLEQYRNPWNAWKTWKSLAILENHPEHPVHRAGATIMVHTHSSICGVCVLPHHP